MNAADEAARRWEIIPHGVTDTRDVPHRREMRKVFEQGAEWAAAQIADEMDRHPQSAMFSHFARDFGKQTSSRAGSGEPS